MTHRSAPKTFWNLNYQISQRLGSVQRDKFDERMKKLHERITGIASCEWFTWFNGKNTFDAVVCWFLLLLLNDRDWGVRSRTKEPKEIAAIDNATALLRRWLEGDAPESEEWLRLLPDPNDPNARGSFSSAGYVAAGMGRVFHELDLQEVLDAAANAYAGVPLPKRLARPYPASLGARIFDASLHLLLFPFVIWAMYRDRPKRKINPLYFPLLARTLDRVTGLRWNPKDAEEAELFPQVVSGSHPELLPKYIASLRRQHVEPDEIADAQEILTRMSDVAKGIGLQLADSRYVVGMPPRRLYQLGDALPAVIAACHEMYFAKDKTPYGYTRSLTGNRLSINDKVSVMSPTSALNKFETELDDVLSRGQFELDKSLSSRVFFRTQPSTEYWAIEFHGAGDRKPSSTNANTSEESPVRHRAFHVCIRSGPWPVEGDLWEAPPTQRRQWFEFPTRSSALSWYRREIDRQLATGFTESLPRLTFYSMKTRPFPLVEGKLVFDSDCPAEMPEAIWINQKSQPAFRPVVAATDTPHDGAKVSGTIVSPSGTPWPVCPACQTPMSLLLQLNLDRLPAELEHRHGSGWLQFFLCQNEESCSGQRGPFTETQLGRIIGSNQVHESLAPPAAVASPPQSITGWQSEADYPCRDDFYDLGFGDLNLPDLDGEDRSQTLSEKFPSRLGDKLAGWPSFCAGSNDCPECSAKLQHVFQLNSSGMVRFSVWENTLGLIQQCPKHHHVLAFVTGSP
jgi:uncharacterized protein DUF1963